MRLEFREGHFDRVEIRTAGRQEQEVAPMGLEHPRGGIAVVGGQVVEDDHGPWVQFRDQNLFDAAIEGIPIQGSGDPPGCHGPTAGQACDQGPVASPSRRRGAQQKHLARRRSAQPPVHQIPETDPKGHRKRIPHGTSFHTG